VSAGRMVQRMLVLGMVAGLFCTPLFLYLGVADQENDEAIYSYAVQSILETGDWMNPRSSPNPADTFLEKPPLKFWIVALPIRIGLLPNSDFGMRFWDAVFGSLAFLYIFSFGRRMGGWVCGVVALAVLYTFDTLVFVHGLRSNSMEGSLVLAYAGGVYHYLRWAESESRGAARAHAAGVGLFFFLGFMTKFVAAVFLPMVLAAATLELPSVRQKAMREWRTWAAVAAGACGLVAPWFVYQTLQPGHAVWEIMFGAHVFERMSVALESSHVKPWDYYFRALYKATVDARTLWLAVGGAAFIHARVLRERWLAGTLNLYWFWLPLVVISAGTSKLWHYTYPFLPPVALAAGYLVASVARVFDDVPHHRPITWAGRPVARAVSRIDERTSELAHRIAVRLPGPSSAWTWARRAALASAAVCLGLGVVGLVHPEPFSLAGIRIVPQPPLRAAAVALLIGLLAGRGALVASLALPVMLLSTVNLPQAPALLATMESGNHHMRSVRDCVVEVRGQEQSAARPVADMVVFLPTGFGHQLFYYYRTLGWERHAQLTDDHIVALAAPGPEPRPVLVTKNIFESVRWGSPSVPTPKPPYVEVSSVAVMMLPGPYARCAQ
jgi:hypothetical protein